MHRHIGPRQDRLLTLIANQPGITAAELNRIDNRFGRAHKVTYDSLQRLLRRGIIQYTVPRAGLRGDGLKIALGYENV